MVTPIGLDGMRLWSSGLRKLIINIYITENGHHSRISGGLHRAYEAIINLLALFQWNDKKRSGKLALSDEELKCKAIDGSGFKSVLGNMVGISEYDGSLSPQVSATISSCLSIRGASLRLAFRWKMLMSKRLSSIAHLIGLLRYRQRLGHLQWRTQTQQQFIWSEIRAGIQAGRCDWRLSRHD